MAVLELFALILARFGAEVPAAQLTAVQQTLMQAVLEHPRPAVRKRAITAVGVLVGLLDDAVLGQLLAQLVAAANSSSSGSPERLKTVIACLTQICRTTGHRLGAAFEPVVQLFLKQARAEDDDELKELAVQGVEVLLYRSPARLTPHTAVLTELCLELLAHDPNYAYDDDEDEDGDEQMADADGDFDDDDDDDEEAESYSDDEDVSWKVRRAAAKTIAALIQAYPDNLTAVLKTVAPVLIRQLKEREESVCLENIACFAAVLKQVNMLVLGAGGDEAVFAGGMARGGSNPSPPSSKKRRTRSTVDKMDTDDQYVNIFLVCQLYLHFDSIAHWPWCASCCPKPIRPCSGCSRRPRRTRCAPRSSTC